MGFIWKEKLSMRNELSNLARPLTLANSTGVNRRAIGLMPSPIAEKDRQIADSSSVKHRELMLLLESTERTLCLRVYSPVRKSRSAALVFRGKVLGCVHGEKGAPAQKFGREAFQELYFDFVSKDSIIERYELPETLALSGGSLFHGSTFNQSHDQEAKSAYEKAASFLLDRSSAGLVVAARRDNSTVGFVYIFDGQVIGVFSFKDGWIEPDLEQGLKMVSNTSAPVVMASELKANSIDEVKQISFGIFSGLEGGALSSSSSHTERGLAV